MGGWGRLLPPRSPSLDSFGTQNALVALSLAKTGAKAVDWTGVVVTAVRWTALQTGRGTLSCVGCGHWTTAEELARISLIGREPPRGSSLNSAHHGCHGVGQSEVKVSVMLVSLSKIYGCNKKTLTIKITPQRINI